MATKLKLILLDETMLPGTGSDIWLEPQEASFISASHADDLEVPAILLVCRTPGAPTPTALEQKATGSPGQTLKAGLIGSGILFAEDGAGTGRRLNVAETTRVTVERIEAEPGGWSASVSPWPYERGDIGDVQALVRRFYQALLVSLADDTDAIQEQIEAPVKELEGTDDELTRLFLLADYLFDSPSARRAILEATSALQVQEMVSDALELISEGLPSGPKAVRPPLLAYLNATAAHGIGELEATASVIRALAPLMKPTAKDQAALSELCDDLSELQVRFDTLITRLMTRKR